MNRLGIVLALGAVCTLARGDEPKVEGDLAKVQGTWAGKIGPDGDIAVKLTIKGMAVTGTLTQPDGVETPIKAEIKLDEKASPKTIDFSKLALGENDSPDVAGIYKLEGETWVICQANPGAERPSEFKSGEGSPPWLVTWTKVKDKDEPKFAGDLGKFQGSWVARYPAREKDVVMKITGSRFVSRWPIADGTEVEIEGELKLEEKKDPKRLDFLNLKTADGDEVRDVYAIYAVEGEDFKVCLAAPASERPTEFKAGEGEYPAVLVFKKKPAK